MCLKKLSMFRRETQTACFPKTQRRRSQARDKRDWRDDCSPQATENYQGTSLLLILWPWSLVFEMVENRGSKATLDRIIGPNSQKHSFKGKFPLFYYSNGPSNRERFSSLEGQGLDFMRFRDGRGVYWRFCVYQSGKLELDPRLEHKVLFSCRNKTLVSSSNFTG